jgi:hypothetical protein
MTKILYRMIGFDKGSRFPGQDEWCDYVYAGEDGSILALLGRVYVPRKPKSDQGSGKFWDGARKGKAGDWYRFRQTNDESHNRWYTQIRKRNGSCKEYVHHLVLWAWHGPTSRGDKFIAETGRHLNGIPSDNRRWNLEWGSVSQDRADRETPENRARVKARKALLNGARIVLDLIGDSWQIQVFHNGSAVDPPELPKISSSRRSNPISLLRRALNAIETNGPCPSRENGHFLTSEKSPQQYDGHLPWSRDCNYWIPNDFDIPDEHDEAFTEEYGNNRYKDTTIVGRTGILYEFVRG